MQSLPSHCVTRAASGEVRSSAAERAIGHSGAVARVMISLDAIEHNVRELADQVRLIARAMEEQSRASEDVVRVMDTLQKAGIARVGLSMQLAGSGGKP